MKNLDTTKILKRIIIVSWVALGCCFLIKLLGGNLFEIVCNNQRFITICNYADNHLWAKYILGTINTFLSLYLFLLAICGRPKYFKWEFWVVIATVLIGTLIKVLNQNVGAVFDLWQFIVFPIILLRKTPKKFWKIILANALVISFQFISMITKNIGIQFVTNEGILVSFIFSIDVNIMLLLYYLYSNSIILRKEKSK